MRISGKFYFQYFVTGGIIGSIYGIPLNQRSDTGSQGAREGASLVVWELVGLS
jgi:hypothetical protein